LNQVKHKSTKRLKKECWSELLNKAIQYEEQKADNNGATFIDYSKVILFSLSKTEWTIQRYCQVHPREITTVPG